MNDPKISKSEIQTIYQNLINNGVEDWDARAQIINDLMSNSTNVETYNKVGTAEYFFTIQTIWNLCNL